MICWRIHYDFSHLQRMFVLNETFFQLKGAGKFTTSPTDPIRTFWAAYFSVIFIWIFRRFRHAHLYWLYVNSNQKMRTQAYLLVLLAIAIDIAIVHSTQKVRVWAHSIMTVSLKSHRKLYHVTYGFTVNDLEKNLLSFFMDLLRRQTFSTIHVSMLFVNYIIVIVAENEPARPLYPNLLKPVQVLILVFDKYKTFSFFVFGLTFATTCTCL